MDMSNINSVDKNGQTPLHIIAEMSTDDEYYLAAKLLLRHGADATIKNNNSKTPLEVLSKNNPKTQKLLEDWLISHRKPVTFENEYKYDISQILFRLCYQSVDDNEHDLVIKLLGAGANPFLKDSEQRTMLMVLPDSNPKIADTLNYFITNVYKCDESKVVTPTVKIK